MFTRTFTKHRHAGCSTRRRRPPPSVLPETSGRWHASTFARRRQHVTGKERLEEKESEEGRGGRGEGGRLKGSDGKRKRAGGRGGGGEGLEGERESKREGGGVRVGWEGG